MGCGSKRIAAPLWLTQSNVEANEHAMLGRFPFGYHAKARQ